MQDEVDRETEYAAEHQPSADWGPTKPYFLRYLPKVYGEPAWGSRSGADSHLMIAWRPVGAVGEWLGAGPGPLAVPPKNR
jgi:hypothetical protein